MIGTWQDSAKLGVVGVSLWVIAYSWYFIGTNRIVMKLQQVLERLHLRAPPGDPRIERRRARKAAAAAARTQNNTDPS